MADLIAQGAHVDQRWRRTLPQGQPVVIGRTEGRWTVPWDIHISRSHVELQWLGDRLEVRRLSSGRNPVFVQGSKTDNFDVRPGEHFVIGRTTFSVVDEHPQSPVDAPDPVEEQAFTAQYLQQIRYSNANQRIEVLSRLPEVISGASSDTELFVRLVNMLLIGIPRATAIALLTSEPESDAPVNILHWDRRLAGDAAFQPSRRLIHGAIRRRQSVLHVFGQVSESGSAITMQEHFDWAFCTPVLNESCNGWGIYVAGTLESELDGSPTTCVPTDLRDDVKFSELVAAILGSLRQVKQLQQTQASLAQFFAPAVLDTLGANDDPTLALEPRETEVSVLFCDLRGFSLEAERDAGDLLGLLNRVSRALGVMTHHILEEGGVVGDFQGDAAMGFWGWPLRQTDAVERSCRAALAIRAEFEDAANRPDDPLAHFRMGIGIATGKAVAGKIGTADHVKVTVFGPVVNLASRLEGMTKLLQAPILLDETAADVVRTRLPRSVGRCRRLARLKPYGLDTPLTVSELLPPESKLPQLSDTHLEAFESAVDALLDGRWSEALEFLQQVPAQDRVKDFLMVFIAQHNRTPPAGWNGVIPLERKN